MRCRAHNRQGDQCLRAACAGASVCRSHGGAAPQVRAAAAVRLVEQEAMAELARAEASVRQMFGKAAPLEPITNPLEVYAEFAGRVMAWMKTIEQLLADLRGPRYAGLAGEQIRGEVVLFERAMDRCNTVLSTYARLGIDDRLARISEAQAYMVMQAIEAAFSAAGVTGQRAIEAKRAAAGRLRVVDESGGNDARGRAREAVASDIGSEAARLTSADEPRSGER